MSDTGLISYHLKELAPLVEQSKRGKYCLSEVGQASMTLFRKVEREKDKTGRAVQRELEKMIGETVFLFFIVGITALIPLSVDIYLSVETIYQSSLPIEKAFMMYSIGLLGMIFGVLLFVFYDRHYFSRSLRTNVIHTTIFATAPTLLSISSVYVMHYFEMVTSTNSSTTIWLLGVFRGVSFLVAAPIVAYVVGRLLGNR